MTFLDAFVQTCKWFGYVIWAAIAILLTFGPFVSAAAGEEWKHPWLSIILGIVSGLLFGTYIVYKMQGVQ